jgi:hypothetical protein
LTTTVGVLQLIAFGPFFIPEVPDWVPHWVAGGIVIVLGLLWAVWFFAVIGSVMAAWKRRCSDVRMSPWGVEVWGGPAHGLHVEWKKVTSDATTKEVDGVMAGRSPSTAASSPRARTLTSCVPSVCWPTR